MEFPLSKHSQWHFYQLLDWPLSARAHWCWSFLVVFLGAATIIVFATGGTAYAYPYLTLIPVLFAAAWYGLAGGLITAFIAGALMAVMPLDVEQGVAQEPFNWMLRLTLYLMLGGVAGWLFQSLRAAFRERQRLVRTDPRSHLRNQVALDQDLRDWLASYKSRTAHLGLLVVRITDITEVLEAMGADASDELAERVGDRLAGLVGERGQVYRFSVSELAVLLKDTDETRLSDLANKVIELGEDNIVVQGVPVRTHLVIGGSSSQDHPRDELSTDALISEARVALFAAIDRSMSYCRFLPELKQRTTDNIRLISKVREGLRQHEFEMYYQPKIRMRDGALAGCECLIRWRDHSGELIPPDAFMPKVENTTLITPVTEFVTTRGCEFVKRFGKTTSINFSARNLVDERLLAFLQKAVRRCEVAPQTVEIEVTESALIQNLEAAREAIIKLRGLGFGVSIDDFGTGFASFDYLRRLPITGIKIDRAFVCDLETDERARKLMACMVDMGHALDLEVTAEGVETAAQYRLLREMGCDQAQGFYFSPALPAQRFLRWCDYYRPVQA